MTQLMRSWRGLSGQPLRGPASGRNLERGDVPERTENHVSHVSDWTSGIIYFHAFSCMCKHYNNTKSSYLSQFVIYSQHPLYVSSGLHSEKDTEEWFDDGGGQRSWLVQWFGDAGVSWARIPLDIKTSGSPSTAPLQCLQPTWQSTAL